MKAIILGGRGQDGTLLKKFLKNKGYSVLVTSKEPGRDEWGNHIYGVDVTKRDQIFNILRYNRDVDEIYNLSAKSHVGESFSDMQSVWDVNANGCFNLVDCVLGLNIRPKIMQASSREIFGNSYEETERGSKYITEGTPLKANNPYGMSKAAAYKYIQLCRNSGIYASNCILFNHESELRPKKFLSRKITSWLGEFIGWVRKNNNKECPGFVFSDRFVHMKFDESIKTKKLEISNLETRRDWGYAGDYVEAMWLSIQHHLASDYIICTGKTHSIKDFLDLAFLRCGVEDCSDFITQDLTFSRPKSYDNDIICSPDKAKSNLLWEPKTSFKDMVFKMVDNDVYKNI